MHVESKLCCNPLANILSNDMLQVAFSGLNNADIGISDTVNNIEQCSLRTFIRDGKKGKYSS